MSSWATPLTPEAIRATAQRAIVEGWIDAEDTAVVLHDLGRLRSQIEALKAQFPGNALHAIAIKANPLVALLREVVKLGAGLEAASIEEVHIALRAGCPPERIVFDSPAKTIDELTFALQTGVMVNGDNIVELERIDHILNRIQSTSRIGLRVNPMVGAGTIGITSVADSGSKFGLNIESQHEEILNAYKTYPWLTGLHVHVGSQGCDIDLLSRAAARIQSLVDDIEAADSSDSRISFVDLGGGLPVEYVDEAPAPSLESYVKALKVAAPQLMANRISLVTEFGRAVQAGNAFAMSRVEYVKSLGEDSLAVVHLGADFLMRSVYRPDEWPHRYLALGANGESLTGPDASWTIGGPLCFSGDILSRGTPLPASLAPNDWVLIRDVGAYTLSMWSRHCSRGMPKALGFKTDGSAPTLLRRRESPEAVARFWDVD